MNITIDQLVAVDRKMGDALAELQSQMDTIDAQRKDVRSAILEMMKEQGADSIRTKFGTVTKSIKERFWTSDWAVMNQYILDHGAVELFERRLQQTNMKEWIAKHPDDYPPGLNIDREFTISIRKPRKGEANYDGPD